MYYNLQGIIIVTAMGIIKQKVTAFVQNNKSKIKFQFQAYLMYHFCQYALVLLLEVNRNRRF